jgi:hypothetical protein
MAKRSPFGRLRDWFTGASAPVAAQRAEVQGSGRDRATNRPGPVWAQQQVRYRAEGGQLRRLPQGSKSAMPNWTTRDTAEQYVDKMDARYQVWRSTPTRYRPAMGPESAEARERRINRISRELAGDLEAQQRIANASADELAAVAREAQRYSDDSPFYYH